MDETLSTLKFGARAKRIKNKPKINKEMSIQEVQHLLEEETKKNSGMNRRIRMLEKMIHQLGGVVPKDTMAGTVDQPVEEEKRAEPEIQYVEKIVEVPPE